MKALQCVVEPKPPVKSVQEQRNLSTPPPAKPFKITPILLKYSYYVQHITFFTFNQPRSLCISFVPAENTANPMLSVIKHDHEGRGKAPAKSPDHVVLSGPAVVKPERDKDQSSTQPLSQHHVPVVTRCKHTLLWPTPFVNTCTLGLLNLIGHSGEY